MARVQPAIIRRAIIDGLSGGSTAAESADEVKSGEIFVPALHHKALDLQRTIVVGVRGAGKSFWTKVLADDALRAEIAPDLPLFRPGKTSVCVGFAQIPASLSLSKHSFDGLASRADAKPNVEAAIWRTLFLVNALDATANTAKLPGSDWRTKVDWVQENADLAERLFQEADIALQEQGRTLLVLFDGLEDLSPSGNWSQMRTRLKGLLQSVSDLRRFRNIKAKLFLRPDMLEDADPWRFPDGSKLKAAAVNLEWQREDLYAMLLQRIANGGGSGATAFQSLLKSHEVSLAKRGQACALRPEAVSEEFLRPAIEAIAGPFVGTDRRRGLTYSWISSHLADALGRVSPRGVLLAFREAGEETEKKYPGHSLPLHHEAIRAGVAAASRNTQSEIGEDYPWVAELLELLRGVQVPIDERTLLRLWRVKFESVSLSKKPVTGGEPKLPPRRFAETNGLPEGRRVEALLHDMHELGVAWHTYDLRWNIPDIYRVGFGILRKGGVKAAHGR